MLAGQEDRPILKASRRKQYQAARAAAHRSGAISEQESMAYANARSEKKFAELVLSAGQPKSACPVVDQTSTSDGQTPVLEPTEDNNHVPTVDDFTPPVPTAEPQPLVDDEVSALGEWHLSTSSVAEEIEDSKTELTVIKTHKRSAIKKRKPRMSVEYIDVVNREIGLWVSDPRHTILKRSIPGLNTNKWEKNLAKIKKRADLCWIHSRHLDPWDNERYLKDAGNCNIPDVSNFDYCRLIT